MRKYLAKLDWNNMLMNKTAIECWNILKYEIESIIDKFVPFQKQGKRCRKKHLSKEAIRKIMLKQTMWRVYRRTRKEEDYAKYKEALNAATTADMYMKDGLHLSGKGAAVFADKLSAAVDSDLGTMTNIFGSKHSLN